MEKGKLRYVFGLTKICVIFKGFLKDIQPFEGRIPRGVKVQVLSPAPNRKNSFKSVINEHCLALFLCLNTLVFSHL